MRLSQILHSLPSAIAEAGAYIQAKKYSFAEFLQECPNHGKMPTDTTSHQELEPDYSGTLECSAPTLDFQHLSTSGVKLLEVLSFMHYESISEVIFARAARGLSQYCSTLPLTDTEAQVNESLRQFFAPFMTSDRVWDHQAFRSVITELLEHSMIEYQEEAGLYSISPECHTLIRKMVQDPEFTCRCAIRLLATSIYPHTSSEEGLFRQSVIPHVDHALLQGQNINVNDAVLFALAYGECGRWPEAELLQKDVFDLNRELLGETHPGTIESMQNLVDTYRRQGREEAASRLLLRHSRYDAWTPPPANRLSRVSRSRGPQRSVY